MTANIMNSDDVRSGWGDLVDSVITGTAVLVGRGNKPVVAVIHYDDFVALREQLEDLNDLRQAEAAIAEYERDPSTARPWEEIKAEWDARDAAQEQAATDE